MSNKNNEQSQNNINQSTTKINSSDVIQKHHDNLSKTFDALKPNLSEINILNYNINKDDSPEYIIEKLELLFYEIDKIEKKLETGNEQSLQFFTDIATTIKAHCLDAYKDLHLLFIKAEDIEEKKDFIENGFMVGKVLDRYTAFETLYKASKELIPITSQKLNIKELIAKTITKVKPIAYYKQLIVDYKLAIDLPDLIISDQYRLQTILKCLIDEAIKSNNFPNC